MSTCVYTKRNFMIIKMNPKSFIIYNKSKEFEKGHTHINDYHLAKSIIEYLITGRSNSRLKHLLKTSDYIKESVRRIK